jgi:hypothetical protein
MSQLQQPRCLHCDDVGRRVGMERKKKREKRAKEGNSLRVP